MFASGIAKVALVGSWACGSSCMIELTLGAVKGAWLEGVDVLIVPCGGFHSMGGGALHHRAIVDKPIIATACFLP